MPRVKRGTMHTKRRKNILKSTKGFYGKRKSGIKAAKEARLKAEKYAYRDRKAKKRLARQLWTIRINAAAKLQETNYSKFIAGLKDKKIELDRKVLSEFATDYPKIFSKIIDHVVNTK